MAVRRKTMVPVKARVKAKAMAKAMAAKSNWIADAVKNPGAFSAKAKAAGMSTKPGSEASTTTKLSKMRKKK